MDDTTRRQSGIPRPVSRLPVPRPSGLPKPTPPVARSNSTVRPKASRDSIISNSSVGEASRTTLRASASRDQLRPASRASVTDGRNARIRASASHDQLRSPAKPRSRPTTSTSTTNRGLMTPSKRNSVVPAVSPQRAAPKPEDEASPFETSPGFPGGSLTPPGQPMQSLDVSPLQERLESLDIEGSRADECAVDSSAPAETPKSRSSKPRPSLSERTMETLARIPSSPAMNKRPSSFFDANGRARSRAGSTSSRPGSSHASEGSRRTSFSRPGSSSHDEGLTTGRVTSNTFKTRLSTIDGTPGGGSTPVSAAKSPGIRKSASRSSLTTGSRAHEATSPSDKRSRGAPSKPASKSMAARPPKTRAPVGGLSKKASLPAINLAAADDDESQSRGAWDGSIPSAGPKKSLAANEPEGATSPSARKSSSALRDQIAKAKAAKRAAMQADIASQAAGPEQTPIVPSDSGFDFGVEHDDPFNTRKGDDPSKKILSQRVGAARTTGRLNIAALGLKEIPVEVMKMYDLESMTAQDGSWAESVDLTRLVAADNELEHLDDSIFPDSSPESMGDSESEQGNIFGGLETIDLHGNLLANVPLGFRRLSNLTSLNLSSNRLQNNSIDAIAQMTALRDLKLAKNLFFGPMSWELSNLTNLEILDLHGNNISAMPRNVDQMSRLRILNLNENSLEMLPFESLSKMPLTELLVKKNKLSGALIRDSIECLPQLQTLDASLNQLTGLVPLGATIDLPALSILTLSINRLQGLPDMTTWTSLLTLAVDENSISSIPNSFFGLEKLRHADFSGNDIRVVPPEVARMDSLSMIRLNGNPLRDKKFVSITTEELKDHLAARLEPPPPYQEDGEVEALPAFLGADKVVEVTPEARTQDGDDQGDSDYDDFATPPTSRPHSQSRSRSQTVSSLRSRSHTLSNQVWPVKQGGLLDRSRTESSSLNSVIASKVAAEHQVKEMQLHNNLFASIPSSLSFFAATLSALNMAHNELIGETYLTEAIELPALKDLSLMTNRITGLDPLVKYLRAPMLEKLDVSINRLNALPKSLKETFPKLMVLNLSGNQVSELEPDSIKGLKIVDASSNEIARLDPRIGLLGGPGGLERFDVMGNRFKVPRWNILESGTQALLQWLRSRVSAAEMTAWREANGDEDNFDDVD